MFIRQPEGHMAPCTNEEIDRFLTQLREELPKETEFREIKSLAGGSYVQDLLYKDNFVVIWIRPAPSSTTRFSVSVCLDADDPAVFAAASDVEFQFEAIKYVTRYIRRVLFNLSD